MKGTTLGSKLTILVIYSLLASVQLSLSSCTAPKASPEQGTLTRENVQAIEQRHAQILLDIEARSVQVTSHPGVKILIEHMNLFGANSLPIPAISQTEIAAHYGEYTESAQGVFQLVAPLGKGIKITYLDGTEVFAQNFEFSGSNGNELSGYVISISTIGVFTYTNSLSGQPFLKGLPSGLVEVIQVIGGIFYERNDGTTVGVSMHSVDGGRYIYCKQGGGMPSLYRKYCNYGSPYLRGNYLEFTYASTNRHEVVAKTVFYKSSQTQGVWLARGAYTDITDLSDLYYSVGIEVRNVNDIVLPKLTEYQGSGSARLEVNGRLLVAADTVGGPYRCDFNNPATLGDSGNIINLKWSDDATELLFPRSSLSCTSLIWTPP